MTGEKELTAVEEQVALDLLVLLSRVLELVQRVVRRLLNELVLDDSIRSVDARQLSHSHVEVQCPVRRSLLQVVWVVEV